MIQNQIDKIKEIWSKQTSDNKETFTTVLFLFIVLFFLSSSQVLSTFNSNHPLGPPLVLFIYFVIIGEMYELITKIITHFISSKCGAKRQNGTNLAIPSPLTAQTGLTGANGEGAVSSMTEGNQAANLGDPGAPLGSQTPPNEETRSYTKTELQEMFTRLGCLGCKHCNTSPYHPPCRTCDNGDAYAPKEAPKA